MADLPEPDRERFDPRFVAPERRARRPRLYLVGEAPGEAEPKRGGRSSDRPDRPCAK